MNHSDIAALMKGLAPAVRDVIMQVMEPLVGRVGELEAEIATMRSIDHTAAIQVAVTDAVASLPPAPAGKDGRDGADGKDGLPGKDGKDGEPGRDGANGKDGLPGKDGKDGADGKDGRDGAAGEPGADGKDGKDGERGADGAPGKLALVKAFVAGAVHYEADVVAHGGATYQALKDTANPPPHADWICLASAGKDGADGRSFTVRGTFSEAATYAALDVVALNAGAFVAKVDDPGACPGEGWQLIAGQGKRGAPGESRKGDAGPRGMPGPAVVDLSISADGLLTLTHADGTKVECDLYPLLSKVV